MIFAVRENRLPHVANLPPPLRADHPLVAHGLCCPACDEPFLAGQRLAMVLIGPGPNPESQEAAREGRWHTAASVPVHAPCAGVQE